MSPFPVFLALAVCSLSATRAAGQIRRNTGLLHHGGEASPVSLIVYTEKLPIRPESRAAFLTATTMLSAQVRREPGCRDFGLYEASETPGTFFLVEEWANEAALAAHQRRAYELAYQSQLPAILAAPATTTAYQVHARTVALLPPAH
jgi:quinol monooxygenase YgiN